MRFHIVNLGCKVNRVESDEVHAFLQHVGWDPSDAETADLIVVNTCTVTAEADKKTRKTVHRALQANDSAHVVVTGCAAALAPDTYAAFSPRVEVVPKLQLMRRIEQLANVHSIEGDGVSRGSAACGRACEPVRFGAGFNTRASIKVQDGCAHACTYCIVHVARGLPWSKPFSQVKAEIAQLAAAGAKEIVLTGINLGSYEDGSLTIADVLADALETVGPDVRFRLSSIEPMDIHDDLIDLMAQSEGRICRHLHLPVQSGSTKVLREMDRPYSAEEYLALVEKIRLRIPALSLSTDIIAGFPGETESDFAQSIALCKTARFSKMHVFPYSRREGTPAAARSDQIPPEVKAQRTAQLRDLSSVLRAEDAARRKGTVERALVEATGMAMTESYYEVQPECGAAVNSYLLYRFL